jgi:hypothetical protein
MNAANAMKPNAHANGSKKRAKSALESFASNASKIPTFSASENKHFAPPAQMNTSKSGNGSNKN